VSLGDAALTFVSVFVAALLAFYLDGLRERRATQRWVREYLGFWRGMLHSSQQERAGNDAMMARIDQALARWLEPAGEPEWSDVDSVNVNNSFDFTQLLLSSGVGTVPPHLLEGLFEADATRPALQGTAEVVTRLFESEIRPLVLARVVDLDPTQRRAVELYRAEFARLAGMLRSYVDRLDVIHDELVRAGF
jgi:hypothetical protein